MPSRPRRQPTSFLSLPFEVRSTIYRRVLISPISLIAHSTLSIPGLYARYYQSYRHRTPIPPTFLNVAEYLQQGRPVEELARALILSHPTIAVEVAEIFYSANTFRFHDEWIWDTVLEWLVRIGPRNRTWLRNLELNMRPPQHVWQSADGTRKELPVCSHGKKCRAMQENAREKVYPRSRLLQSHEGMDTEGVVGNISPAVEKVFELLGTTVGGKKLTMKLLFEKNTPGIQIGGLITGSDWMRMDLPNVMERCRELYASDTAGKCVEILWNCITDLRTFVGRRQLLENKGWEILNVVYACKEHQELAIDDELWESDTKFTLRRKRIEGILMADLPSKFALRECKRKGNLPQPAAAMPVMNAV